MEDPDFTTSQADGRALSGRVSRTRLRQPTTAGITLRRRARDRRFGSVSYSSWSVDSATLGYGERESPEDSSPRRRSVRAPSLRPLKIQSGQRRLPSPLASGSSRAAWSVFGFFLVLFFKSAHSGPAFQLCYSGLEGGHESGHCLGEGGLKRWPLLAVQVATLCEAMSHPGAWPIRELAVVLVGGVRDVVQAAQPERAAWLTPPPATTFAALIDSVWRRLRRRADQQDPESRRAHRVAAAVLAVAATSPLGPDPITTASNSDERDISGSG